MRLQLILTLTSKLIPIWIPESILRLIPLGIPLSIFEVMPKWIPIFMLKLILSLIPNRVPQLIPRSRIEVIVPQSVSKKAKLRTNPTNTWPRSCSLRNGGPSRWRPNACGTPWGMSPDHISR